MRTVFAVAVAVVLGFQAYAALINIPVAVESPEMLSAFVIDEGREAGYMVESLAAGELLVHNYQYGRAYAWLSFHAVRLLQSLGYTEDGASTPLVARTMRLISLFAAGLSLAAMFALVRRLTGDACLAFLAALLMGSLNSFYHWSQLIHPDTLQLFFLILAAAVLTTPSLPAVSLASFLAGLAFGTKHFGIFLLPFLLLAGWIYMTQSEHPRRRWVMPPAGVASFFAGWVLFNSAYLANPEAWLRSIGGLARGLAEGLGRPEPMVQDRMEWFALLGSELSIAGSIVVGAGLVLLGTALWRHAREVNRGDVLCDNAAVFAMAAYCAASFLYLLLFVTYREGRFLLPILPFAIALSFAGISMGFRTWGATRKVRYAIYAVLLCALLPQNLQAVRREAHLSAKSSHPVIRAAQWMESRYSADTVVLYEKYAYVPERLDRRIPVWGVTPMELDRVDPDVVILTRRMSGRWLWKAPQTSFEELELVEGPLGESPRTERVARLYRFLFGPRSEFRAVFETEELVILERVTDDVIESGRGGADDKEH
ncbi:MAG: phospholipid carrier-dependent glycosyltransferase [Candidatus Eisenbacteria bacterium]|nr:phospholipid carrier-dependent glycosyltransferase [Candidatus Eisenbacteria bacterium]